MSTTSTRTASTGTTSTGTTSTDITSTDITSTDITAIAADLFGWDDLHPAQRDAIDAVLAGRDVVAVMPTGFGKSAIYQVAGAALPGVTVVVSPLIALQADQVAGLAGRPDAPPAVAVNSSKSEAENDEAWHAVKSGKATYVFLAPEQLARDEAVERLAEAGVDLFVVDEAHCVSTWGHDFRPDYLHLAEIVRRLGRPPVLALTATGSGPVRDEIVERLGLDRPLLLSHGFDRPNLFLEVVRHEDADEKERAVLDQVSAAPTPLILYVATRRETESYASQLAELLPDRTVVGYHGGQRSAERGELHRRFHDGEVDVVVATSAFGMGIDKPDVRAVVHADVPDSLDAYYQEIGRAGRDGDPATATLHYRPEDLSLHSFFASGLPSRAELRDVFTTVAAAGRPVSRTAVAEQMSLAPRTVSRLIDLLLEGGAVAEVAEGFTASDEVDAAGAADAARGVAKTRERVERSRIDMMRTYAETTECRRRFLLGYFGQEAPERCGECDTCRRHASEPSDPARASDPAPESGAPEAHAADTFPVDSTVVHEAWGRGTVMSTENARVTVFFESEGYKVLAVDDVVSRGLLNPA